MKEGRKEEKIPVTIAQSSVSLAWSGTEKLEEGEEETGELSTTINAGML